MTGGGVVKSEKDCILWGMIMIGIIVLGVLLFGLAVGVAISANKEEK